MRGKRYWWNQTDLDLTGFLTQRNFEHLLHGTHVMKLESLDEGGIDLFHVFLILPTKDDLFKTGTFRSEYLFLDTAHGQDLPTQGDLTGHREIRLNLPAGERRGD